MLTIEAVAVTLVILGLASALLWLTARYERRLGLTPPERATREVPLRLLRAPVREQSEEGPASLTGTDGLRAVPVARPARPWGAKPGRAHKRRSGTALLAAWSPSDPTPGSDADQSDADGPSVRIDGADGARAPESAVPEPAIPESASPEPSIPEPSVPESSVPEPSSPGPSSPEPSVPEPSSPEPSSPEWAADFARRILDPELGQGGLRIEEFRDGDVLVLRAEIPDSDPDRDVQVTVTDGTLRIHADRRQSSGATEKAGYHTEFRYGTFTRAFPLPEDSRADDVEATYDKGILEVRIPIPAAKNAPVKSIPVVTRRS